MMTMSKGISVKAVRSARFRVTAFVIAVCALLSILSAAVSADVGQQPIELPPIEQVKCASYYVYDLTKGEVVLDLEPAKQIFPASMTKVMTVALALEYLDVNDTVTVSKTAMDATTPNSTMMGLKVDENVTVRELLYGAMLPSGNDAANVLGESVAQKIRSTSPAPTTGGTQATKSLIEEFVDLMNRKASELGLQNTHFMNTNGLHHAEHYTTAAELAKIFEYALGFDEFRTVINAPSHVFKSTNIHPFDGWSIARNTNYLLGDPWIVGADSKVAKIIGGKTGTTITAGTGMVLLAVNKNGDEMITVVCGIPYDSANRQTTYVAAVLNAGAALCFDVDPVVRVEGNVMNYRAYNAPEGMGPELPKETEPVEPTEPETTPEPTAKPAESSAPPVHPDDEKEAFDLLAYLKENVIVAILGILAILFVLAVILLIIIPSVVRKKRRKRRSSGFQGIRRI